MIFRITDYVHYGTLDNRKRGTVHLTLQLMGMPHPVNITLHGDCLQDLAGCVVDFRNPSPQMLPAELTQIPEHIQGVAGDMTASRRMPVKGKKTMENALYLEWFTSHHDMVLLESTVFSIKVSLPEWMMDSCEEQAQIMANQQMLRTQVKEWSRAYSNHQEDGQPARSPLGQTPAGGGSHRHSLPGGIPEIQAEPQRRHPCGFCHGLG